MEIDNAIRDAGVRGGRVVTTLYPRRAGGKEGSNALLMLYPQQGLDRQD